MTPPRPTAPPPPADHDARWQALLAPLAAAKVLSPLDHRFALALARIAPERPSDEVVLGAAAASAALTRGDICLELSRAAELLRPGDEDAALEAGARWPAPDVWRAALGASPLVSDGSLRAPLVLDGDRLYLHRYFDYQRRLARALNERAGTLFTVDEARLARSLEALFAGVEPDPTQRHAAEVAVRRGLTIISGGPGTGKTSTVVRILGALAQEDPRLRAVLVAPTGKAATRLSESIREQLRAASASAASAGAASAPVLPTLSASTIHRALGFRPQSPTRFAHDREHPLAADVVVLDEASMVDLAMMTKLVEAVPARARLVMLGDKDQLASVAAGHVLGDIAEAAAATVVAGDTAGAATAAAGDTVGAATAAAGDTVGAATAAAGDTVGAGRALADCFAFLTKSHRFAESGGIGALARAIKAGDEAEVCATLRAGHAEVTWDDDADGRAEERLRELAVQGFAPLARRLHAPEVALEALSGFQLLCAHRRGRRGAERLTEEVRLWLAAAGLAPPSDEWYPGRPIIVLVNDHAQDLWNGDTGVVLRDPDDNLRVHFPKGGAGAGGASNDGAAASRALSIAQLPTHATFYATTIHKAQGSGFDHVVAVMPQEPSPVVTRELLYTAVTRARRRVTLVASEAVVRHAVRTRVQRASGLVHALAHRR